MNNANLLGRLTAIIAVGSGVLLGCGRKTATIETHSTTNGKYVPAVATLTEDDLKGLNPTNGTMQEIVIWTNAAGDKSLGITRDGGVWFRMKF
jgi:hypothetical protein